MLVYTMRMRAEHGTRLGRTALSVLAIAWGPLAGCTSTTSGEAVRVPADPNDPIVALLDTGSYPTTAGPPAGAVGNNNLAAAEPLLG
jgi:hypothetical protein